MAKEQVHSVIIVHIKSKRGDTWYIFVGKGPIWLDDVGCTAGDEVIEDCYSRGWGVSNCYHYSDVGVVCQPSMCVNTMISMSKCYL